MSIMKPKLLTSLSLLAYTLQVKVANSLPKVTVKQIGKFDTFYLDSTAQLTATASGYEVERMELIGGDTFRMDEDGNLFYAESYNPGDKVVTKGTLLVYVEGYQVPVKKNVTVATTKTAPKLTLNPSASAVNRTLEDPEFATGGPERDQAFLRDLIAFYVIFEGMWFYTGFAQILSLGRRNKMVGIAEQYQYILRDESIHLNFGIDCINQIKIENPHLWSREFQEEVRGMLVEACELEVGYGRDTMPRGILGLNAELCEQYMHFITNRRCAQLGLEPVFAEVDNPFPWMSEAMDLKKEKNFFETRVTEYQSGASLSWD